MKKIISLILILIMALSAVPAIADETSDITELSVEEIGIMSTLGILNSEEINLYNKGFDISRAAFVRIINRACNSSVLSETELPFWDVNADNEYYGDIALAYSYGIIDGGKGDAFRPYDIITYSEAVKMVGVMLGYKSYAQAAGGYPKGYMAAASEAGYALTSSYNSNAMTFKSAVRLIFNALTAPMVDAQYSDDRTEYSIDSEKTLLEYKFAVVKTTGIVEANGVSPLVYGDNYIPDHIMINGEFYEYTNADSFDLIGYNVNCYYEKETYKVIYICKYKNASAAIDAEDFIKATSSQIEYYKGKREKTMKLSASTVYLYNGKAVNYEAQYNNIFTDFTLGTVQCIDNTNDGIYDVVKVVSFVDYIVKGKDTDDGLVYGVYNNGVYLNLSEDVVYSASDNYGNTYAVSDFAVNDSLMAAVSFDGEYTKILYCNDIIEGVIRSRDSENNVVINNKEYKISSGFLASGEFLPIGASGIFYLNAYGQIAYYTSANVSADNIGMLYKIWESEDQEERLGISMAGSDKKDLKFLLNEPVKIDGNSYKDAAKIKAVLNPENLNILSTVVRYIVNDEGFVSEIDTPELGANESADDSLRIRWTMEDSNLSYKSNGRLGTRFMVNNSVLFTISDTVGSREDISAYAPSDVISDDQSCSCEIYTLGNDSINAIAMVINQDDVNESSGEAAPISNYFCVFDSIIYQYDEEEGETIGVVTYYSGTAKNTCYIKQEDVHMVADLKIGDAFLLKTDNDNFIVPGVTANSHNVVKIYDYETDTVVRNTNIFQNLSDPDTVKLANNNRYRIVYAKVYEKVDSYIRVASKTIDYNNLDVKGRDEALEIRTPYASYYGGAIYEVDRNRLIVTTPSLDAIRDFETIGDINKTDTILSHTEYDHDRRQCYFRHND